MATVEITGQGGVAHAESVAWSANAVGHAEVVEVTSVSESASAHSTGYSVEVKTGIITDIPTYEGAYEADALFSEQTFDTGNKLMSDDFTVHAINYTEAPNDSGITLTIGG